MANHYSSAKYEQFIIDNEIRKTRWAMRLQQLYDVLNGSDDLVRDSKHRLRICQEDVPGRGKRRNP